MGWDLQGKRALIVGGTLGIGAATAEEFSSLGAEVLVIARNANDGAFTLKADITSPVDRRKIVDELQKRWGALDIVVNSAGTNIRKPWLEISESDQELVMQTNLLAPTALARALQPLLANGISPSVINVASVAGLVDVGSGAAYALSKAALIQFTRSLAVEWATHGIRVNAVAPWYIRTPLTEPVLSQPDRLARIVDRTPLGRVGLPNEVAAAIAFLAMDKASYITGHCLTVDGGFLCNGL